MTGEHEPSQYEKLSGEDKAAVNGFMRRLVTKERKLEGSGQFEEIMKGVETAQIGQADAANMLLEKIKKEHPGRNVMDVIRELSSDKPSTLYTKLVAESRQRTGPREP